MFIGRKNELKSLCELYETDGFGMSVIYGRRRIGKSTLINEFINLDSRINMTRLVPQLRVLHKSQPA